MSSIKITEESLSELRERVRPYMNDKRFAHTLGVERECVALGSILLPEKVNDLRAAALLHDITKMLSLEKQLKLCALFDIIYGNSDILSPKLFHAKTASELIKRDFPEFADDEIVSAVRWHTTGRRGMTLFESILYLADYIEDTRTFPDCVELRSFFWDSYNADRSDLKRIFMKTMIRSFDMTIAGLISDGAPIDKDTVDARNYFLESWWENDNELHQS